MSQQQLWIADDMPSPSVPGDIHYVFVAVNRESGAGVCKIADLRGNAARIAELLPDWVRSGYEIQYMDAQAAAGVTAVPCEVLVAYY